ncbi:MAG: L-2-hydroxyglutarate oxidase [Bdellovibrionales bacterium]|nr:L-2-hydroxyglutarate oxidase [Bdellovibrionales bacterium]
METVDAAVIGGGIVGLATAFAISERFPTDELIVLEKETDIARHQTGHNSGVVHTGIYYPDDSLKSSTCLSGRERLRSFCESEGIPFQTCGTVIVATDEAEVSRLNQLFEQGQRAGISCRLLDEDQLRQVEPHVRGVAGLSIPSAAITDFAAVSRVLAGKLIKRGHGIQCDTEVTAVRREGEVFVLSTAHGDIQAKRLVNCAGLYADKLARMIAPDVDVLQGAQIVPFRGDYFYLKPGREHLCSSLIYPVPDPRYPFLGVHLSRKLDGRVICGPNAVLAFGREAYGKFQVNLPELFETLRFPGYWSYLWGRIKRRQEGYYKPAGFKPEFLAALQRLVPELEAGDLEPAPSGIRAQLVRRDGSLLNDFWIESTPNAVHVLNAPSPAATASLALGEFIAREKYRADE